MSQHVTNQSKWKPWKGFVLFGITMVIIILGGILSTYIGIWGTLLSQAAMLGLAIAACLINKTPLKEVFPIKKITFRDLVAVILLWIGGHAIGTASIYLSGMIFPNYYETVNGNMETLLTGGILIVSFITVVLCPPICEEAITRGAILSNFRGLKHDWLIVLIIGLMFGAMHTDPIRFINTAILGATAAYFMVKRNNLTLPALLHLINNFVAGGIQILLSMFVSDKAEQISEATSTYSNVNLLSSTMVTFCFAPICIVLGVHLIRRQNQIEKGEPKSGKLWPKIIIATVLSIAILAEGLILQIKYPVMTQAK
ncbi:MAG: CPBP family intramembrane metalloprotease [Clostridiales bacterium]|nr:CPBP family intramembrane metalloprotease [Clostridiales bacterium]